MDERIERNHKFIDSAPTVIGDLPDQKRFKADLASEIDNQIAVVFVDLDHFKRVNDTKGHQAGDACLAKVVEIIGTSIVGKGKLYRYGGDEFVVILQNVQVDEAAATAERIRKSIQEERPGSDINVTASIGVAASDQKGLRDVEKLISAADTAQYNSKNSGKNKITKHTDEEFRAKRPAAANLAIITFIAAAIGILFWMFSNPQPETGPTPKSDQPVSPALTDSNDTPSEPSETAPQQVPTQGRREAVTSGAASSAISSIESGPSNAEATARPSTLPPPVIVVSPSAQQAACPLIPPDRAPNVALQPGDVVFTAEGGLLRLDRDMKSQRIVVSDDLADIRGIAVEGSGTILVSTRACGSGAILRVDPRTGYRTLVATGFRTPKAILIEPSGTLLVADEVGGSPTWGYLWRIDLQTGEKGEIYRFAPSDVATGMGVDGRSGDIFFTRRGLYRLTEKGVSRMEVEGVLSPTSMTMAGGNLLVSGEGQTVVEIRPTGEVIATKAGGGPITDLAARGNQVFVGYGNGRVGRMIRETDGSVENVWEGRQSAVFLAVVPDRAAAR